MQDFRAAISKANISLRKVCPDKMLHVKPNRILAEERRRQIIDLVNRQGTVLVPGLARQFSTSEVTIRQDLEALHNQGYVHRAHGGALPVRSAALLDRTLSEKEKLHRREKHRIAVAAARLVKERQSVVLDSGSTTTAVARALRKFHELTIITNAVNIAAELAGTSIQVILTGGMLREDSFSLIGPLAESALERLSADLLFLGVDGFDINFGLTTPNLLEANVNRVMMKIARRRVVVCDSSKFASRSLSLIAAASDIHQVITDRNISELDLTALKDAGINVTVV
jgi:DeoR family transcriptional regulator, aga operon transcriptional repressor